MGPPSSCKEDKCKGQVLMLFNSKVSDGTWDPNPETSGHVDPGAFIHKRDPECRAALVDKQSTISTVQAHFTHIR